MSRSVSRFHYRPSRRAALKGLLASAIGGLPWLETFTERSARAESALPTRFVVMFSPNGTLFDQWLPAGDGDTFSLSPILAPLAEHQRDLVIVAGVDQQGGGGDAHQNGMSGMLTGAKLLPGRFSGVGAPPAGWSEGPSVDQHIADAIGHDSPFRSLELGVQTGAADNWGRMIYRARNRPLAPREDPARVFDDVFGSALLSPEQRAEIRARRESVLDHVTSELSDLASTVSAADRQRLDSHLTYLREVEARIAADAPSTASCALPARPNAGATGNDAYPNIGEQLLDLLVLALACGQTRVASLQWSRSVSLVRFTWLGIDDEHHALSHLPDSDATAQDKLLRINRWYAERFAGLISRLKRYAEGDRTLFDRCLVLWSNELGKGNTHSRSDAPYVLAGSAGGALATGRLLKFDGDVPHNNLLLSILKIMGLPDTSFGRSEWCTGYLPGLV